MVTTDDSKLLSSAVMMDNIDKTNNNPAMNNLLLIFGCECASLARARARDQASSVAP